MRDKPKFTEELWNELRSHQQEREAQERERIRQAIATSGVPLPPELVRAVIHAAEEEPRDAYVVEHAAWQLATELEGAA